MCVVVVHGCWSKMAIMVCVCMSASPSLSHSSQVNEGHQKVIKEYEEVSDECSSGVMRVGHVNLITVISLSFMHCCFS